MTKHETAEKYLRDGGCFDVHCGNCDFHEKCFKKYGTRISDKLGLELAKAYLAKKDKKMKKNDGWRHLDLKKLSDLTLIYEFEISEDEGKTWHVSSASVTNILANLIAGCFMYRYRPIQAQVSHEELAMGHKERIEAAIRVFGEKSDPHIEALTDAVKFLLDPTTIPPEEQS